MDTYKTRIIDEIIPRKLRTTGGVLIRGPRFVGKTTTANHHAHSSIRMDESDAVRQQAILLPKNILNGNTPRLIDEWQLVPSLWNSIRNEIDSRNLKGQFILTGSAAPSDDITMHSGAGRISRLNLRPMSLYESKESLGEVSLANLFADDCDISGSGGLNVHEYAEKVVRGGWPALVDIDPVDAQDSLIDYLENLAYVDLRNMKSPPTPERMTALIRAIARNIATEASLERLAKESEIYDGPITAQTTRKYLDQLSQVFVLEELSAWKTHLRSSAQLRIKPKWHFVDPSLATAALRVTPDMLIADLNTFGFLFESLVVRDLRVYSDAIDAKVYQYRDSTNLEVDAIVERYDGKWLAIEVKLGGDKAIEDAVSNFKKLKKRLTKEKLEQLGSFNIITAGEFSYRRPDGVNVIALGHLKP
ncbi:MAG: DUF4143 domain-containing protein [Clostridiales Family XIII bacterium]|nr:DUF4143 domain-containing protein [Clostridiales Family XIII bacterium]